jgi:hypothetical protein
MSDVWSVVHRKIDAIQAVLAMSEKWDVGEAADYWEHVCKVMLPELVDAIADAEAAGGK